MYNYFTIPNFLSEKECDSILNKCMSELTLSNGTVRGGQLDIESRKSSVAFLNDLGFLNDRLRNILVDSIKVKGFEVSGIQDFQFTEYTAGGYYNWHRDSSIDNPIFSDRFYSTVIQLSDKYTEGELQLSIDGEEITLKRGLGTLYMFPSYTLHRVTPIESGVRYSLVNWIKLVENKNEKKSLL